MKNLISLSPRKEDRYEIKYRLQSSQKTKLQSWIASNTILRKKYSARKVYSLYFDTNDYLSAYSNIIGLSERWKVRLRFYSEINKTESYILKDLLLNASSPFLIEIKRKKNDRSQKFSVQINKKELLLSLESRKEFIGFINTFLHKNLDMHFPLEKLSPVSLVVYEREYFEDNFGLRLTIDTNIRTAPYYPRFRLRPILNDQCICELKFGEHLKSHASITIKDSFLTRTRSSKYIYSVSNTLNINY